MTFIERSEQKLITKRMCNDCYCAKAFDACKSVK